MTDERKYTQEQAQAMYTVIGELSLPDLSDPYLSVAQLIRLAKVAQENARALLAKLDSDKQPVTANLGDMEKRILRQLQSLSSGLSTHTLSDLSLRRLEAAELIYCYEAREILWTKITERGEAWLAGQSDAAVGEEATS